MDQLWGQILGQLLGPLLARPARKLLFSNDQGAWWFFVCLSVIGVATGMVVPLCFPKWSVMAGGILCSGAYATALWFLWRYSDTERWSTVCASLRDIDL